MAEIILYKGTAPATPSTGNVTVYSKTDGFVYSKNDNGVESVMSSVGLVLEQVLNLIALRA
jgi:hypothetical protein